MSIVKIRIALETALNAMTPELATSWENVAYAPTTGVPYQAVSLLAAPPDNPTMGGAFHRELGYLQVTLNYPLQSGPAAVATRAELIRSAFPRGASFSSGGVTTIIDATPEIGRGQVDGDRWAVPVKIRWHADVFS
ncbi:MAG: phage tail terminator-like protein [Herbaspirillum sp.]